MTTNTRLTDEALTYASLIDKACMLYVYDRLKTHTKLSRDEIFSLPEMIKYKNLSSQEIDDAEEYVKSKLKEKFTNNKNIGLKEYIDSHPNALIYEIIIILFSVYFQLTADTFPQENAIRKIKEFSDASIRANLYWFEKMWHGLVDKGFSNEEISNILNPNNTKDKSNLEDMNIS